MTDGIFCDKQKYHQLVGNLHSKRPNLIVLIWEFDSINLKMMSSSATQFLKKRKLRVLKPRKVVCLIQSSCFLSAYPASPKAINWMAFWKRPFFQQGSIIKISRGLLFGWVEPPKPKSARNVLRSVSRNVGKAAQTRASNYGFSRVGQKPNLLNSMCTGCLIGMDPYYGLLTNKTM